MKRTQIYLDDAQDALLAARAAELGATKSELIRGAIDRYLERGGQDHAERRQRWLAALDTSFGVASRLPDGATYVTDVRSRDAARRLGSR